MSIFKNLSMIATGAAFIVLGTVGSAQATTLVAPNSLANVEGNSLFTSPFAGGLIVPRYQQVYEASQFSSLSGPQYINQISFRPNASGGSALSNFLPSIQISLSTTNRAPDGLSPTFSENIGTNNTVVHNGSLALISANTGPENGPRNFDVNVNLQTPFLYNPALGNLLLDVRQPVGGNPHSYFDAEITIGDSISSLSNFSDANATNGSLSTLGLVTQFTTTPAGTTPPLPTPIPFEFSPSLGILMLGAWGAIAQLKNLVQKRKSSGSAFSKNL